ncbi:hypothetical protein NW752_008534 [Fusarium irregulare]|uniref:Uncharacterized protein n=1 Tax=Fusarium irregulare TaxID=2494466 RepID=A0A9W8PXS7_9HYPO|nr:hypothetical protein NW752_008534 [Fusarium irregulare]KAJ4020463.1 hypothetical protein NW766_001950 [Fusarium irregulare]
MSGKTVLPESSGLNPLNTSHRRLWMESAFRSLGLWDNLKGALKFEGVGTLVENGLCELFDRQGWRNVSHLHFLMAYDESLWHTALKFGKINPAEAPWPWGDCTYPPVNDLTEGVSRQYKRWRVRFGKSTEEPLGQGAKAQKFEVPPEETKGNVATVMASASQQPAGQGAAPKPNSGLQASAWSQTKRSAPAQNEVAKGPAEKRGAEASTTKVGPKPTNKKGGAKATAEKQDAPAPARSTKSAEAFAADVAKVTEKYMSMTLDGEAKKEAIKAEVEKEKEEIEAIEADLLAHHGRSCQQAQSDFDDEISECWRKRSEASSADTVEDPFEETYLSSKDPLPVRDRYCGREGLRVVGPCLPTHSVREFIWEWFHLGAYTGPFVGPFELAIPGWLDFDDLVLHDIDQLHAEELIDRDLVIAWQIENGRPVSLVVGENPIISHEREEISSNSIEISLRRRVRTLCAYLCEWLTAAYNGSCFRLVDFLRRKLRHSLDYGLHGLERPLSFGEVKDAWSAIEADPQAAQAIAEYERKNFDLWMPQVHAILSQSHRWVAFLLHDWVMRDGMPYDSRISVAYDIWSMVSLDDANLWKASIEADLRVYQ